MQNNTFHNICILESLTEANEFLFAVPLVSSNSTDKRCITITSHSATTGTLHAPHLSWILSFSLNQYGSVSYDLPPDGAANIGVEVKGILVTSVEPISVQLTMTSGEKADMVRVLKSLDYSMQYMLVSGNNTSQHSENLVSITAATDNTHVKIIQFHGSASSYTVLDNVLLNRLQVFTKRLASGSSIEFTGLMVESDKPVNVIGGSACTQEVDANDNCDIMLINYPTVLLYGREHYSYPLGM